VHMRQYNTILLLPLFLYSLSSAHSRPVFGSVLAITRALGSQMTPYGYILQDVTGLPFFVSTVPMAMGISI
jgi:hypothetical protein